MLNRQSYFPKALDTLSPKSAAPSAVLPLLPSEKDKTEFFPAWYDRLQSALPPVVSTLTHLPKDAKICFYKGTFNPPHKGHVANISDVLNHTNVDCMVVIPDYSPPHKRKTFENFEHRFNMTRLATKDLSPKVVILSTFDPVLKDKSIQGTNISSKRFTLENALSDFRERKGKISFLHGTDALDRKLNDLKVDPSKHPEEEVTFLHAPRQNMVDDISRQNLDNRAKQLGVKVIHLPSHDPSLETSSTHYRNQIRENKFTSEDVSPLVQDYINTRMLYRKSSAEPLEV